MSTPHWKPFPVALMIATRTSGSRPALRTASASANQPATGSAFTGGLSIVTSAMWSRTSDLITARSIRVRLSIGAVHERLGSLWHNTVGEEIAPRPAVAGDVDVDVAIIGAGYTGLWTAHSLRVLDPH